jgi:hypothetical protein
MVKFIEGVKTAGLLVGAFVAIPYLIWAGWNDFCQMAEEENRLRDEIARLEGRA